MGAFDEMGQKAAEAYRARQFDQALALYLAQMETNPDSAAAPYNAANVLRLLGQTERALSYYDRALERQPTWPVARFNRAFSLLQAGRWREGFAESEWRKACPDFTDPRYRLEPQWRGEDVRGHTIFIYPEFYLGDLIQFVRYALLLERGGARVILAAPQAMHAVLRWVSGTIELIAEDATPPHYDFACALLSLPVIFGTTPDTVPAGPYLRPDPDRVARWQARLGSGGVKIGVVWQGSSRIAGRSFPLRQCVDHLAQLPDVRLIALQKGPGLDQLADNPAVETPGDDFDAGADLFLDTAAAIACCDLFVTGDTSTAHLAGAMGKTTCLALHQPADWRWLETRRDTPWYPSTRLFRQAAPGDWDSVFAAMAREIRPSLERRG